ncbi:MAG: ferredoxin--NADP reductase [Candidatus Acidiferrales bacterium]
MASHSTQLKNREEVAQGTMAFHLEKPSGFEFKPGQYLDVSLVDPPPMDAEGAIRTFSIASAPYENELVVATRMRDTSFKRELAKLPLGTQFKLEGPSGSFTLHKNTAKPAVLLAGGIGITPFRSMVRQAASEKLSQKLYLFYSNRRPEDAAFLDELQSLSQAAPNFIFTPSMSEMGKSSRHWAGEQGFIDRAMITKYCPALDGPIFYVAGPPAMVSAMQQMLAQAGVNEDDVRTEEFGGY